MAGKKKRLTNKEKKFRAEVREDLRQRGIIPPVKTRLNRKKFAQEVQKEFYESFNGYSDIRYLYEAIALMIPSSEYETQITSEQIGVLKTLKLALEIKKFMEDKRAQGETEYKVGDLYEQVVKPVLNL